MVDEKRSVAGHQIQLNTSFFGPQDTTEGTEFGMFSTVKFLLEQSHQGQGYGSVTVSAEPRPGSDQARSGGNNFGACDL